MIYNLFLLLLVINGLVALYLIRKILEKSRGWLCLSLTFIFYGLLGYVLSKVFHIIRYETFNQLFSQIGIIIEIFSIILVLWGLLKLNRGIELLDHKKIAYIKVKGEKIPRQAKKTKKNKTQKKKANKTKEFY